VVLATGGTLNALEGRRQRTARHFCTIDTKDWDRMREAFTDEVA
jgi:hypothetical protein